MAGSLSSPFSSAERACVYCASVGVQLKLVSRTFGTGNDLLVIERIPIWSCPSCGESYFTARTMHELERIKALRKSLAKDRKSVV